MEKSLIEIPDFNPGSVLYLTEVTRYKYFKDIKYVHIKKKYGRGKKKPISIIGYKQIKTGYEPIISWPNTHRSYEEQLRYWIKFIFKSKHGDPLESLWKIQQKYPKLLYKKFIFERQEQFPPKPSILGNKFEIKAVIRGKKSKPNYNPREEYYEIKYLEINESLLKYLRNKIKKKDIELVNKLQELFINKSTHFGWDEFLQNKAKFLLELDYSNYVKDLNKQISKKNVKRKKRSS